jgi:hypothetical protein
MVPDVGGIVTSVHGETRSGFRPTGVRAIGGLMIVNAIVAAVLAHAGIELWALPALFSFVCAFTFALAIPIVYAARVRARANLQRWPADAKAGGINDAKEAELVSIRGRVVMASAEAMSIDGVPCVALSKFARGGVTTRAVPFVIEDGNGQRVAVEASQLIACGEASDVVIPVGAEVEIVGTAQWTGHGAENSNLRSGPGLVLAGHGDEPVRVRRTAGVRDASTTLVRVANDLGDEVRRDDAVDERERGRESEQSESRRAR